MRLTLICSFMFASIGLSAAAQQIAAVAVSPDGTTLQVAGENRVVYSLDAATLTVSDRRYLPEQVQWLAYSDDGATIFMHSSAKTFTALGAGSFKERFSADKVGAASYSAASNRVLLMENHYKGGKIRVVAASSGKNITTLELPELRTDEVVLSDDGNSALVLTNSESSDTEEKSQPGSDLKGYPKYDYRQRHDGYISKIVAVDLKAGTYNAMDTWYRVSNPSQMRMLDGAAAFVKTVGDSAILQPDGTTTLIDLGERYMSFSQISNDGQSVFLCNGTELSVHKFANGAIGDATRNVKADKIPGPAERVTAMAEASDGTLYFATSAYRILKLAPGATVFETAPVF